MDCQEINLEDENGELYKCIIPTDEYNRIIGGDYDLANKYLQKEIEKKHRLLAFQLLVTEKNQIPLPAKNVSTCSSDPENIENTEDNTADLESSQSSSEAWSYDAVLALILSMASHYDDLTHPKMKKHVFANVSNELLSKQLIYPKKVCYNKWRSLLRSYKATKDKRKTTGQGATRFMFFNQLDEILGDKPSHSCGHTVESYDASNSSCLESSDVASTAQSEGNTNQLEENSNKENINIKKKESVTEIYANKLSLKDMPKEWKWNKKKSRLKRKS